MLNIRNLASLKVSSGIWARKAKKLPRDIIEENDCAFVAHNDDVALFRACTSVNEERRNSQLDFTKSKWE